MSNALRTPAIESFNNRLWREMINQVCKQLDFNQVGIEAISPFGFELLEDKRFLSKNLKRFYCYIGLPYKVEPRRFIENFSGTLFSKISQYFPELFHCFILKIHQDQFIKLRPENYIPKKTDKLLDIQVRYVATSILDDYADYIICTLAALHDSKDEAKFFMHNTRFRSRTFQLYIMQECLFNYLLPPMNQRESHLYNIMFTKIRNNVDIFYDANKLILLADDDEMAILNELVKPRIQLMLNAVKNQPCTFKLQTKSFHVPDDLTLEIGNNIYYAAKIKIKNSYLMFQ